MYLRSASVSPSLRGLSLTSKRTPSMVLRSTTCHFPAVSDMTALGMAYNRGYTIDNSIRRIIQASNVPESGSIGCVLKVEWTNCATGVLGLEKQVLSLRRVQKSFRKGAHWAQPRPTIAHGMAIQTCNMQHNWVASDLSWPCYSSVRSANTASVLSGAISL